MVAALKSFIVRDIPFLDYRVLKFTLMCKQWMIVFVIVFVPQCVKAKATSSIVIQVD